MNLSGNKLDFDIKIDNVKRHVERLEGVVTEDIIVDIQAMLDEYSGWLSSDIDEAIILIEDLEAEIEELKDKLNDND